MAQPTCIKMKHGVSISKSVCVFAALYVWVLQFFALPSFNGQLSSVPACCGTAGRERQLTAKRILDSPEAELHINLQKLRKLAGYREDLAFAATTGFCGWRLYVTLFGVFTMAEADVQESERLNKALTLYGHRCPNGSLELGSSRAAIKHLLGVGGYGIGGMRRFKDVKPTATRLLQECVDAWPLLDEVERSLDRFGCAHRRSDVPSLADAKKAEPQLNLFQSARLGASNLWAVSMNSKLGAYRKDKSYHIQHGLTALAFTASPKPVKDALHIFLVTDKVRTTLHLACCRKSMERDDCYVFRTPLCILKSHDLFQRFYKWACVDKQTIDVFELSVHTQEVSRRSNHSLVVFYPVA